MLIIIDSNYVAYAQKFALSSGLTYRGGRTEIIFGFLKTVFNMSRKFETERFIFCWDSKDSLRKELYPEYKANRRQNLTEEEEESNRIAHVQFNKLKTILPQMGFANVFEEKGYESDDIIASLVTDSKERIVVVSSDKDLYQLLNWCALCDVKGSVYTKDMFVREYRINPSGWRKVKSIAGCSTDNIKGASGVGEKTAIKYLKRELKETSKAYEKIKTYDSSLTNRLVSLPFEGCPDFKARVTKDTLTPDKFRNVFKEYGFNSLLESLDKWEQLFF